ncbi:MAG: hypothetical protein AB7L09_01220 [Nitrospira sp.]
MRPADRSAADGGQLDNVIEQIETALPIIHRMCRVDKKQKKSPTDRICREAQPRFQKLSEDPIVNSDATDILGCLPKPVNQEHRPCA